MRPAAVAALIGSLWLAASACGVQAQPSAAGATPRALGPTEDFARAGWKTDFSRHSVPLGEIHRGGPGRDGIPPLDHPKFVSVVEAGGWLRPTEPVISLALGSERRAYPLQILIWHEIVNDQLEAAPVAVTFCPLCNSAIAFDRRLEGRVLDFGTTGNLRNSDLLMWDRETESWWQQVGGEAIVGSLTGRRLAMLPVQIVGWDAFRLAYPEGRVLSRDTGFTRVYGENPYDGYDDVDRPPFLFTGKIDGRLPPKERVVTVSLNGEEVAYPYSLLAGRPVVADTVGGSQIVVWYLPGTQSALDSAAMEVARAVGATGVFRPEVGGRKLTFVSTAGGFRDQETGSAWNLLGQAVAGPLRGSQLELVVHGDYFWFAWAAFKPQTRIYR
ncbi:MAG TPA: DUF3179 domain-containing protein [Candidatus Acidoferrales bacterium]|nr:DUF3179 domain-containing protein [Candidatus Acidoferrales bacterium]